MTPRDRNYKKQEVGATDKNRQALPRPPVRRHIRCNDKAGPGPETNSARFGAPIEIFGENRKRQEPRTIVGTSVIARMIELHLVFHMGDSK